AILLCGLTCQPCMRYRRPKASRLEPCKGIRPDSERGRGARPLCWASGNGRLFRARGCGAAISADVGGLGDGLAFHCGEKLGPARSLGQVEFRVEGIEIEDVVVIARARRGARAHVGVRATEV